MVIEGLPTIAGSLPQTLLRAYLAIEPSLVLLQSPPPLRCFPRWALNRLRSSVLHTTPFFSTVLHRYRRFTKNHLQYQNLTIARDKNGTRSTISPHFAGLHASMLRVVRWAEDFMRDFIQFDAKKETKPTRTLKFGCLSVCKI